MQIQVDAISSDEGSLLPGTERERRTTSQREIYARILDRKGESRAYPVSVISQLSVPQNNPYAKVEYFGFAYSNPHHIIQCKLP